jgi:hypothetical protein
VLFPEVGNISQCSTGKIWRKHDLKTKIGVIPRKIETGTLPAIVAASPPDGRVEGLNHSGSYQMSIDLSNVQRAAVSLVAALFLSTVLIGSAVAPSEAQAAVVTPVR